MMKEESTMNPKNTTIITACIGFFAIFLMGYWRGVPPEAKPLNSPAREFSGMRAFQYLKEFLPNSILHPIGSKEHGKS